MSSIFDQMLSRYEINTNEDKHNALHEVIQQITLSALYRAGFFTKAAFYGGTCLRIFYDSQRFSEDMDFSLMEKDENFTIENYFDAIRSEFKAFGREVSITKKNKKQDSQVESAFLKDNTEIVNVEFQTERTVKVKIEIDRDPPLNFSTEHKLLLLPFSFMTRCFTLPSLFAGKMHALLFRNWRNRVKGRDWYDLEWYCRNGSSLDFEHLKERSLQSGYSGPQEFTKDLCIDLLKRRIESTSIEMVKADVNPFIKNTRELDIWSNDYFLQLADMINFE
jgi:predicted nucleotidyltransferase component of viral defense system